MKKDFLQGYRTIIANVLALIFVLTGMSGLDVSPEDQAAVTAAVMTILNIVMRLITSTPVGKKPETQKAVVNKQSGFIKIRSLFFLAVLSMTVAISLPSCSLMQEKPWQPFADCANLTEVNRTTLGACFVSAKILANNIDAAADAMIITSEQEIALLDKLESAVEFLSATKLIVSTDPENAVERLRLAQAILAELIKQAPKPE